MTTIHNLDALALDIPNPFTSLADARKRWREADQCAHAAMIQGDRTSESAARLARDQAEADIHRIEHHLAALTLAGIRLIPKYYPTHTAAGLVELVVRVEDLELVHAEETYAAAK